MRAQNEEVHGDVDQVIAALEELDRSELARLQEALKRRLWQLGVDGGDGERPISGVVEYRPHADCTLQAEVRAGTIARMAA